ncbi:hypothetical protein BaRGS_00029565 [Batillaria attramentaria]|uniref:Uncharacterized protein n=1 Tax=Batillaria attramentaria TaxID=370345 RepID=A0ABD0JWY2_9CAEN
MSSCRLLISRTRETTAQRQLKSKGSHRGEGASESEVNRAGCECVECASRYRLTSASRWLNTGSTVFGSQCVVVSCASRAL